MSDLLFLFLLLFHTSQNENKPNLEAVNVIRFNHDLTSMKIDRVYSAMYIIHDLASQEED